MIYTYNHAILGGTFDHLHLGHKKLMGQALSSSKSLTIGIVSNPLISKPYPLSLESLTTRTAHLASYLNHLGVSDRVNIITIDDMFGTTLSDPTIEAIFVTEGTIGNAKIIANKRNQIGLSPLEIIKVPYALAEDGLPISSSRIRNGLIGESGISYIRFFNNLQSLTMPSTLRDSLKQPLGNLITDLSTLPSYIDKSSQIISIGDVVSLDLIKSEFTPTLAIIDFQTKRRPIEPSIINTYFKSPKYQITNSAGAINPRFGDLLMQILSEATTPNDMRILKVDGEEDLLALPTLLLSPLGTSVVYGLPGVGMCIVQVNSDIKNLAKNYLTEF